MVSKVLVLVAPVVVNVTGQRHDQDQRTATLVTVVKVAVVMATVVTVTVVRGNGGLRQLVYGGVDHGADVRGGTDALQEARTGMEMVGKRSHFTSQYLLY